MESNLTVVCRKRDQDLENAFSQALLVFMPGHNHNHFKGKSGSDCKKKRGSTRKQRRLNRNTHVNKYSKEENNNE